jgi:hypothetical protein
MSLSIAERADDASKHLLDVTLMDLQSEFGWNRTLPMDCISGVWAIPNREEMRAWRRYGNEDTAEIRRLGLELTAPSRDDKTLQIFEYNFIGADESGPFTHDDRMIHSPSGLSRGPAISLTPRITAAELDTMNIGDVHWFQQQQQYNYILPNGDVQGAKISTIRFPDPANPDRDKKTNPLLASTVIHECSDSYFRTIYQNAVTYRELLAVAHWAPLLDKAFHGTIFIEDDEIIAENDKLVHDMELFSECAPSGTRLAWASIAALLYVDADDVVQFITNGYQPDQVYDIYAQKIFDVDTIAHILEQDIDTSLFGNLRVNQ